MQLIDAHCHLQDERLKDRLEEVLQKAEGSGVIAFVCCGTSEDDWAEVAELAQKYPTIIPCFGIHPWYMFRRTSNWLKKLENYLTEIPSGVGEIGLDHAVKQRCDKEQEEIFREQIKLANALNRPVSIHCRKAWGRLIEIIKEEGGLKGGGVIHAYSGSAELVETLQKLGLYFSFGGTITRAKKMRIHNAIKKVSIQRLLIETDSPDLPPLNWPSPINEPASLALIVQVVATCCDTSAELIAKSTTVNARQLFNFFFK